jgi:hypothetical protein
MSVNQPPSRGVDDDLTSEPETAGASATRDVLGSVGDWFFRDRRSGRIVVIQLPNLACGSGSRPSRSAAWGRLQPWLLTRERQAARPLGAPAYPVSKKLAPGPLAASRLTSG